MTDKISNEIQTEQDHGRQKYGGDCLNVAHDDQHLVEDWIGYINDKLVQASVAPGPNEYRQRMVQAAGLAVSAIESFDRKNEPKKPHTLDQLPGFYAPK